MDRMAPRRVLLVEDEPAALRGFAQYLGANGYRVLEAPTGADGLTLAMTCVPDVIVLDLGLPDIDGWEVARTIRAVPATRSVPIIALTGATMPHEQVSAMRAGCDRHLAKPCEPTDLLQAIRSCLAASGADSR